jgi:hypothetical protein
MCSIRPCGSNKIVPPGVPGALMGCQVYSFLGRNLKVPWGCQMEVQGARQVKPLHVEQSKTDARGAHVRVESNGLNCRRRAIRNSKKERAREEAPPVAVTVITPSRSTSNLHQRITGHRSIDRSIDHLLLYLQHMTLLILPTCMFHETILVFHLCACATKHLQICTPLMS